MKIGRLYNVKQYFWLLFPTKETAAAASAATAVATAAALLSGAIYWSKRFNCEVTYFSPDSIVVFLEEDGKFKKFLTSDGRIGWTLIDEEYNNYFEEMKA